MEMPQYTLHLTVKRMVIPRVILVAVLSPLFYGGIWLNSYVLGFDIPLIIAVFIILFLLVMVGAQGILNYVAFQKFQYLFFTNRIEFEGKKPRTFVFADFQEVKLKQNVIDKMFNTGSIQLSKTFSIGPISNVSQVKTYLEQLVQYYRYQQQRTQMRQAQQQAFGQQSQQSNQGYTTTQNTQGGYQ